MGSARGCPGSTCISPVWLDRCNSLSLSLSLSLSTVHGASFFDLTLFFVRKREREMILYLFSHTGLMHVVRERTDHLLWDLPCAGSTCISPVGLEREITSVPASLAE